VPEPFTLPLVLAITRQAGHIAGDLTAANRWRGQLSPAVRMTDPRQAGQMYSLSGDAGVNGEGLALKLGGYGTGVHVFVHHRRPMDISIQL
jgi:hypothetical protein